TGTGSRADVSPLASAVALQIEPLTYYLNGGPLQPRSRTGLATTFHEAPYGVYRTSDGWIAVSLSSIALLADLTGSSRLTEFREEERFSRRGGSSAAGGGGMGARAARGRVGTLRGGRPWGRPRDRNRRGGAPPRGPGGRG